MFEAMGKSENFLKETKDLTEQYINQDWTSHLRYFLVEDYDRVLGGCGLTTFRIPPQAIQRTGTFGYLSNMFIEPEYRRKGLGRALLGHVIEICRHDGIGLLLLHASKDGHLLYDGEGFQSLPDLMQLDISK